MHSPSSSPWRQVQVTNVAQFLLHHTDSTNLVAAAVAATEGTTTYNSNNKDLENNEEPQQQQKPKPVSSIHNRLGIQICNEVLSNPTGAEGKNYCKLLTMLHLNKEDQESIKTLAVLVDDVLESVKDKLAIAAVKKFDFLLKGMDATPKESLSAEKIDGMKTYEKYIHIKEISYMLRIILIIIIVGFVLFYLSIFVIPEIRKQTDDYVRAKEEAVELIEEELNQEAKVAKRFVYNLRVPLLS